MPIKIIDLSPSIKSDQNDPRVMTESEVIDVANSFDNHVGYAGSSDINGERQYLLWSDLKDVADSVLDQGFGRAVLFFFGLNGSYIRYGVAVVAFTDVNLHYPAVLAPTHHLVDNRLNPIGGTWSVWQKHYQENISFWRNGQWESANALDARCVVLPYETEVWQLHEDNSTHYYRKAPHIVLNSISLVHTDEDGGNPGYRHGLCLYMATKQNVGWNHMLNDTNTAVLYFFKGADFGNLCPPSCLKYTPPELS